MDAHKFGAFIAEVRKEKKMTQADLAMKLQVTDKAVSRWERGLGFPDIKILEPIADALGVSILELMRSEKAETENKKDELSKSEITEIMGNIVEMERENRRQDKAAGWIGAVVTIIVAILVKMSGHAGIGGSLFAGFIAALAAVATFLLKRNIADKISRKIYSFFLLVGVGVFINLLNLMGVNGFMLAWGVFCFFGVVIGMMNQ